MKRFLFVIFILQICAFALPAQKSPPPPLIYKAPEKNEIKDFIAEDKSFQTSFPGVPTVTRQELENGMFSNFRVYRAGSNSVVNISELNFELENDREKIYELIRGNFLQTPKSKIEIEKDLSVSGKPAKEFDILREYHYQKTRILITGKRVYELTNDVTNWHLLSSVTKKEFFDETDRFFNSFKMAIPAPAVLMGAPPDFLGVVENNTYKNTFFNFSLDFPSDWHRLDDTEIKAGKIKGLELLKTEKEKVNKAFEKSTKNEVVIFAVSQKIPGNAMGTNLFIGVLKQPGSQITSEMVAAVTKNSVLTNPKFRLVQDVKNIDLNGTRFSTFSLETAVNNRTFNQKVFVTMKKGFSVSFTMSYYNDEGLKSLEAILNSLNFKQK